MRGEPGLDVALDVLDDDDRVVHHDTNRQHKSKERQVVEREAEQRHEEKCADQRHRNGDDRDDRRSPRLQEEDNDKYDEDDRLTDCLLNSVDRLLDEFGGIIDDVVFQPRWEALGELIHRGLDVLRSRKGVRARPLEDTDGDRGVTIEIRIGRVVLRGELDPRDVLHAHNRVGGLLDDDIAEFLGAGEASECLYRDLESARFVHRWLIEHAGGDLHVLPGKRVDDVVCCETERLQAIGVEPGAHRVIAAAEHDQRADAIDAGHRVGDLDGRVVRDEKSVARFVGRIEMHDHHQVGRALVHGDADVAHVDRQSRLRDRDAVLHLHLRDIEVGAELEAH